MSLDSEETSVSNSAMTTETSKRRKVTPPVSVVKKTRSSKIFSPFRVIGNVSNEIPFAIGTLGATFYIVTSVGQTFQIYDANTLHLLFVSQTQTDSKITSLTAHFHYVYATYGDKIGIYKRGKLEHTLETNSNELLNNVMVFGEYLIASSKSSIFVFKKSNNLKVATEFYTKLSINSSLDGEIVNIIHPPTYLNKIVVATTTNLLIFNVHSGKLIYTSPTFPYQITTIESAPVLDIIAIGNVKGEVQLYNLKKGRTLRTIDVNEHSPITSLSFRTDGSSHLVAGLNNGDLAFFDLDNHAKKIHTLSQAHKESFGGIKKVSFLNGQPILVTNGGDNQLKEYVFDPSLSTSNSEISSPPRHLRSRGGHSAPPSSIEFADSQSHFILSASRDRSFWSFSLRKDAQSQELSQRTAKGSAQKGGPTIKEKFPEIIDIAIESAREGEWENVITAHKDELFARTWDSRNKRIGKHHLKTIDNGFVKSVAISQCGNFGFVGSSLGGIGVYNLQSGILRKKYQLHKKSVSGIALDGMNRKMVSAGLDGIIGFYDFSQSKYLGKLQLDAPITILKYHKSSDLVALALDDLSIVIVDSVTQKVVRILYGHTNRITSLDFSPDGRWVVSSSLDSTIRTWDLPTGGCIDGVRVNNVVTNVKFSPLGDYLATTHVSQVGISLWTNRAQFRPVSTRHIEEDEFKELLLPNASGEGSSTILDGALEEEDADSDEVFKNHYDSLEQINKDLVTLSLGPRSKFNTLLNLDLIKQRNKPKEAPKKPENAPFFLQLTGEKIGDEASVREGAVSNNDSAILSNKDKVDANGVQLKPGSDMAFESEFTKLLREGSNSQDYSEFLKFLSGASPSLTDLEIKSINTQEPLVELSRFVKALIQGYKSNVDVDLIEAWMNMILKNHGDIILANPNDEELNQSLKEWYDIHNGKAQNFDGLIKYCSGVINLLTTV